MSLEAISAAGTIIIPVLIILTYKWQNLDSARDFERSLRGSIQDMRSHSGGFLTTLASIEVFEKSDRIKKYLLFRQVFEVYLTFLFEDQNIDESAWTSGPFDEFCDVRGYNAEFINSEHIAAGTLVKFQITTSDEEVVREFFKLLPSYLDITREAGILQAGFPDNVSILDQLESIDDDDLQEGEVA